MKLVVNACIALIREFILHWIKVRGKLDYGAAATS